MRQLPSSKITVIFKQLIVFSFIFCHICSVLEDVSTTEEKKWPSNDLRVSGDIEISIKPEKKL